MLQLRKGLLMTAQFPKMIGMSLNCLPKPKSVYSQNIANGT